MGRGDLTFQNPQLQGFTRRVRKVRQTSQEQRSREGGSERSGSFDGRGPGIAAKSGGIWPGAHCRSDSAPVRIVPSSGHNFIWGAQSVSLPCSEISREVARKCAAFPPERVTPNQIAASKSSLETICDSSEAIRSGRLLRFLRWCL